jgi:hypothetical protein
MIELATISRSKQATEWFWACGHCQSRFFIQDVTGYLSKEDPGRIEAPLYGALADEDGCVADITLNTIDKGVSL